MNGRHDHITAVCVSLRSLPISVQQRLASSMLFHRYSISTCTFIFLCHRFLELEEGRSQQKQEVVRREEEEDPNTPTTFPSPTPPLKSRAATASNQGQVTLPTSASVTFGLEGNSGFEPDFQASSSVAFNRSQSQADPDEDKSEVFPAALQEIVSAPAEKSQPQGDHPEEPEANNSSHRIETRNYLRERGVVFKPRNPFQQKLITVYAVSPLGETPPRHCSQKSKRFVHIQATDPGKRTSSQHAYVVVDTTGKKLGSGLKGPKSDVVYLQLKPGCHRYIIPVRSVVDSPQAKPQSGAVNCSFPYVGTKSSSATVADRMSGFTGMDIYTPVTTATLSRTQERVELQQLNDRFAAYVQHVRMLAEKNNNVDSSAIIKSTKVLETEIHNLKNMYEQELEKLR